ncbi:hypothetical protein [Porphyrobacter sp. AAP82]|uniref:hypothetical protein n=1 Tax=Porphyrobacter sp. AAP82 TaxID=1248917 RepID=UPI000318F3EA|nr:hypothetical protein [Porphyrobacter sp. AAP82]
MPLLGLWGMALGAGVVLVLPSVLVTDLVHGTLLGTWGAASQPVLAAIGAMLVGLVTLVIGALLHAAGRRRRNGPTLAEVAARRVTPINPARDLGSRRLDDPVETMPFSTPAWRDADLDDPQPARAFYDERAPEPAPARVAAPAPEPSALDLAEFAELPGRNAVWVAERALAAPIAEPAVPADPFAGLPPAPGTAALARLRAIPASELSLAEMVERFAGALHEMRETSPGRSLGPADLAAREAALAEALKALEALSGKGRPAPRLPRRDEPFHAPHTRLQPDYERVRGAA